MSSLLTAFGIDRLTVEQRVALAQAIWDSIATEPHPPLLTDTQRQELERRVAQDEASPDEVIPWEQVEAQTLARLQK